MSIRLRQKPPENWAQEFGQLPKFEQVLRDRGTGMQKGVEQVNVQRTTQRRPRIREQLDHVHVQQEARRALRRWRKKVAQAMDEAECAQKNVATQDCRGLKKTGVATEASRCWQAAEAAMDRWSAAEATWKQMEPALEPYTAEGRLNTRERAAAVVAVVLPNLEGPEWAKTRRMLARPELFTYLDRVHEQLAASPGDPPVNEAIVRAEVLRRQPERAKGESVSAAAARGILLVTAAMLKAGGEAVQDVAEGVRQILRHTWRASSMVESSNSVLRMHQSLHRRLTQEMSDLKRIYWNSRIFRKGTRRKNNAVSAVGSWESCCRTSAGGSCSK